MAKVTAGGGLHSVLHGQGLQSQKVCVSAGFDALAWCTAAAPALAELLLHRLLCRYVDLIVNEGVRDTLKSRARMMGALRRVLEDRGFLEVRNQTLLSVDRRLLAPAWIAGWRYPCRAVHSLHTCKRAHERALGSWDW